MSMHKKPLTKVEEMGMLIFGLGRVIGKPSQQADLFRSAIEWAQVSEEERMLRARTMLKHNMPVDPIARDRLKELCESKSNDKK